MLLTAALRQPVRQRVLQGQARDLVFGERGSGDGQLWLPSDVAIDEAGVVYVSDSYNQRVQIFAYSPPESG